VLAPGFGIVEPPAGDEDIWRSTRAVELVVFGEGIEGEGAIADGEIFGAAAGAQLVGASPAPALTAIA